MEINYEVEIADHKNWIVLIHGAGGSIQTWKYQREAFKQHANLLIVDLRDHGESQLGQNINDDYSFELIAKDVIHILNKLYIAKASFVGLSLGNLIIEKIRQIDESRIESVIQAGGMFGISPAINLFSKAGVGLSYLLPFRLNYWIFSWLIMPRANHQKARKIYIKQAKKLSGFAYRKWIKMYREFNGLVDSIVRQNLNYPMLIIMGSEDHLFLKPAQRFAMTKEKAELKVIQNCGHICNIEQYKAFNQMALQFFKATKASNKRLKVEARTNDVV